MKYISVFIFIGLMAWTWSVIHRESPISFETHAGIQERLAQLIYKTITEKKPEAKEVKIERVWTEPQAAEKVLAHFIYSFQESNADGKVAKSQITGQGLLEKRADDGSGLDHWSLTQVKTTSDAVQFEDLIVTPGTEDTPAVTPPVTE